MPTEIPILPGEPFQSFVVTIDDVTTYWVLKWISAANTRAGSWFLDVYEADQENTPILLGVKLVLGTYIGRRCNHPLFRNGVLALVDFDRARKDPALDSLGSGVRVYHFSDEDLLRLRAHAGVL